MFHEYCQMMNKTQTAAATLHLLDERTVRKLNFINVFFIV